MRNYKHELIFFFAVVIAFFVLKYTFFPTPVKAQQPKVQQNFAGIRNVDVVDQAKLDKMFQSCTYYKDMQTGIIYAAFSYSHSYGTMPVVIIVPPEFSKSIKKLKLF